MGDHSGALKPAPRLRVLHVYRTYLPETRGGVEHAIFQLCESLPREGITADVFTLSDSGVGEVMVGGHRVHRARRDWAPASTDLSAGGIGRFRRLARHYDLLHYHFPWPYMDLAHFLAAGGRPALATYHSDIVRQRFLLHLYRPLMGRFLGAMARIIATSPEYAATSPVLARFRDKLRIIPFGLDEQAAPRADEAGLATWRARVGEGFFLFVGVLRYYKGLEFLLEAARGTRHRLVIAGDGPMRGRLEALAARPGMPPVVFTGRITEQDKAALFALCRAFVFPSHLRSEAFGVSLLEAALYGRAMVSCEISTGTSFVNLGGETGLVVPPADPPALRAALDRLAGDDALVRAMGAAARRRFERHFSAARMAAEHAALYREIIAARR